MSKIKKDDLACLSGNNAISNATDVILQRMDSQRVEGRRARVYGECFFLKITHHPVGLLCGTQDFPWLAASGWFKLRDSLSYEHLRKSMKESIQILALL